MTQAKHTPGPWLFAPHEPEEWWFSQTHWVGNAGDCLVIVEDEANARLIAAAPDMYEALVRAANRMAENAVRIPSDVTYAIAKAEGRE